MEKLRVALFRCMLCLAVFTIALFAFADQVILLLRVPMDAVLGTNAKLVVLLPHEYFFTQMHVALFAGILVSAPLIIYWLFKAVFASTPVLLLSGIALFYLGLIFCYFVVFEPIFGFFVGTLPDSVVGHYSVATLFGFATKLLVGCGLLFEVPLIVVALVKFELLKAQTIRQSRPYALILAVVVGAMLAPPDPLMLIMFALPIMCLFELGLLLL